MKILIVGHQPPIRDGIADHNFRYLNGLRILGGLDLTVLHNQARVVTEPGVRYLRFNPLTFSKQARAYDLIHFEFGATFRGDFVNWCFFLLPREDRPRIVSTLHDRSTFNLSKLYRILTEAPALLPYCMLQMPLGRVLKKSDACIVYSRHFGQMLSARYGIRAKNIRMRYHGADLPRSRPAPSPPPPLKVCSFGAISPRKGYEVPIDAVMELKREGVDLSYDIYGQASFSFYLDRLKRQAAGCRAIRFTGYIPGERVFETLQRYHLIVLPRKYVSEGGSGSLCHAMSSLVPVLGSRTGYFPEYLSHGRTGFHTAHNKDAYKRAIHRIAGGQFDLKEISENCLDFVRARLHWPVICQSHLDLYRRLMG